MHSKHSYELLSSTSSLFKNKCTELVSWIQCMFYQYVYDFWMCEARALDNAVLCEN